MKKYSVEISDIAQLDLFGVYDYIFEKLKAVDSAKKVIQRIRDMILTLNEMPERYPLSKNEKLVSEKIRVMPVGNFHIFYLVNDDKVNVVRIAYGKRNLMPQDFIYETSNMVCEGTVEYNRKK